MMEKRNLPPGNEPLQALLREIMLAVKEKLTRPILEETQRLSREVEKIEERQRQTQTMLNNLQERIQENPLLILSALREAINRVEQG